MIISGCGPQSTIVLNRTQQSYEEIITFKPLIYLCKDYLIAAENPNNDLNGISPHANQVQGLNNLIGSHHTSEEGISFITPFS